MIKNVVVERSTIPLLASDICETFENLEYLSFGPVEMVDVRGNAFTACKNLKTLSLTSNKIEELDCNTFKGLKTLETLYLAGNRLRRLDDEIFTDLRSLKSLHLYFNQLTEFSTAIIEENSQLVSLFLYANDLFDLDIDGILHALPELDIFIFQDNNFRCSTVSTIVNKLTVRKIEYEWSGSVAKPRTTSRSELYGIKCLNNEVWNGEYQKHLVQEQTRELSQRNAKLFGELMLAMKLH